MRRGEENLLQPLKHVWQMIKNLFILQSEKQNVIISDLPCWLYIFIPLNNHIIHGRYQGFPLWITSLTFRTFRTSLLPLPQHLDCRKSSQFFHHLHRPWIGSIPQKIEIEDIVPELRPRRPALDAGDVDVVDLERRKQGMK